MGLSRVGVGPALLCLSTVLSLPTVTSSTVSPLIEARCRMKCASQYTSTSPRIRNDRSVANEPQLYSENNLHCKLGCLRVAGFEEVHDEASIRGRQLRQQIDETATEGKDRSVPTVLTGAEVLCVHASTLNSSRLNISVALSVLPEHTRLTDYYIQLWRRASSAVGDEVEEAVVSVHSFSTLVDIAVEVSPEASSLDLYQIRASAYDAVGEMGKGVESRWLSLGQMRDTSEMRMDVKMERQIWLEDRAAALLSLSWPPYRIPTCELQLTVAHISGPEMQKEVHLDETRTLLVSHLRFEESYTILVDSAGDVPLSTSHSLVVQVSPCTQLVEDDSMCPPPPVSDLSYRWNGTDAFTLFWSFPLSSDSTRARRSSHHFIVQVSLQPRSGEEETREGKQCETHPPLKQTLPADARSALFRLPRRMLCAFAVEMVSVDARNRRSRAVKLHSSNAEKERLEQAGGGVELAILWAVFVFLSVMAISVSIMILRHQQRSANKKKALKEQEHQRVIKAQYGRCGTMMGHYAPAPLHPPPSPPHTDTMEIPRGVYRVGRGWTSPENSNYGSKDSGCYGSRVDPDEGGSGGYAVCELHDVESYRGGRTPLRMTRLPPYQDSQFV